MGKMQHEKNEEEMSVALDLIQATLRRKTSVVWTDMQPCDEETGRGRRMGAEENVRYWLVGREEVSRNQIPEGMGKREQMAKTPKEDWKWQRGITSYPLNGNKWTRSHL